MHKIGYVQIFKIIGVFPFKDPVYSKWYVRDTEIECRIGLTHFPLVRTSGPTRFAINEKTVNFHLEVLEERTHEDYQECLYLELVAWRQEKSDQVRLDKYVAHSAIAAIQVGITCGHEFVSILACEYLVHPLSNGKYQMQFKSSASIVIERKSREELQTYLAVPTVDSLQINATTERAAYWLASAWQETNDLLRFIQMFIPIEILLQEVKIDNPLADALSGSILKLIEKSNCSEKNEMIDYIQNTRRPSLGARFKAYAEESGMEGCDCDVRMFVKMNRIRNKLLHSGRHVREQITDFSEQREIQ